MEPLPDSSDLTAQPLPIASRGRSASCTALDWFSGGLTWSDVEASGYLMRSGSYRSVEHEGPVLDMRHDCVKARSPTVVPGQHDQNSPTAVTPLTAELVAVRNPITTAGRSAPSPTPVEGTRDGETSHASVDNDVGSFASLLYGHSLNNDAARRCHGRTRYTQTSSKTTIVCRHSRGLYESARRSVSNVLGQILNSILSHAAHRHIDIRSYRADGLYYI